jgi:alpha-tubulin suppressor-like RCC1 family protein
VVGVGGTVTQIALGRDHSCALLSNARVRCWGEGFYGQLGYGNRTNLEQPENAGDVHMGGDVSQIAANADHTCALLSSRSVRCWGSALLPLGGGLGILGYATNDPKSNTIGDDELPDSMFELAIGF